tara:strand:+ start:1491 stop:1757 length:267 start_codon:yes stop_codon:yes gene_type:complete
MNVDLNKMYNDLAAPSQLMLVVALVAVVYNSMIHFDLAALLGTVLGVAIAVYNNNCLVKGNCKTWAWVLAALYTTGVLLGNVVANNQK